MVKSVNKFLHIITGIFLLLFAGCINVLQDNTKLPDNNVIPKEKISSEMGAITIDLAETGERTLLPQTPVFSCYAVKFWYVNGGESEINETIYSLPYSKELLPGEWRITVTGYVRVEGVAGILDGDYPCASGEVNAFIEAGITVPVTVDLYRENTGAKGIFEYDIRLPVDIGSAHLRILYLNRNEVSFKDLRASPTGSIALDEGYYFVQVQVVTGRVRSKTELMHIYSGHTTVAAGRSWDFGIEGVYLSLSELAEYLASVPQNTADNPYQVKMIMDWQLLSTPDEFLGQLYSVLDGRYVGVDLSETTGVTYIIDTSSYSANRSRLVSVSLPDGINHIDNGAFNYCNSLKAFGLPSTVITIGEYAFANCPDLFLDIKSDSKLESIGNRAFAGSNQTRLDLSGLPFLTSVSMEGMNYLETLDISDCAALQTIYWGSGAGLKHINLAGTQIDTINFAGNNVTGIIFSSTAAVAGISAILRELPSLQLVDVSACIKLQELLIENLPSLTTLKLSESLVSVEISNCLSLSNFVVQEEGHFITMGDRAILVDKNSTLISWPTASGNAVIPEGITAVARNAFAGNALITGLTIPASVTEIAASAFIGCGKLVNFNTNENSTFTALNNGTILATVNGKLVAWPSAKGIITVPTGITAIGDDAFYLNTTITEVYFADSSVLASIGARAFYGCSSLVKIDFHTRITPPNLATVSGLSIDQFYGTSENLRILVFYSAVAAYKTSWAKYAENIFEKFTVDFVGNGGSPVPIQQIVETGKKASEPAVINRIGYTFDGWYKDANFVNKWNFTNDIVSSNNSLYAKWLQNFTVSFIADGGTPAPVQQIVPYGKKANEPPIMIKTGKEFYGWYTEEEFKNRWDFTNNTISDDITLYAMWDIPGFIFVNNLSDSVGSENVPGTLRHAIANAKDGIIIRLIGITPGISVIELSSPLPQIARNITIEGNGVTITRNVNWITVDSSLMRTSAKVSIKRVHFKNGSSYSGGAINNSGNLSLQSCIFSENYVIAQADGTIGYGGAINTSGILSVQGCTFYKNSSKNYGGVIYKSSSGQVTLEGNVFYGNIDGSSYPIIYNSGSSGSNNNSAGYNVVDWDLGVGYLQSGWEPVTGDKVVNYLSFSPVTFKPISGGGAVNVIPTLTEGYPTKDFYGNPITNGAAAGAVQAIATGNYLELNGHAFDQDRVNISPAPNEDGLYSNTVTLAVKPSSHYEFLYWLIDGSNGGTISLKTIPLSIHTKVQAVCTINVNNTSDSAGSENIPGTLRHALSTAHKDDIIRFNGVTPGISVIQLSSPLPQITNSITIEGNGITITPGNSWISDRYSQLLNISSAYYNDVSALISRVHFKDGRANSNGVAICLRGGYTGTSYNGILTLESCIFSGNQNSVDYSVIYCTGTLSIQGCTFYRNMGYHAAIYARENTLDLKGNLYYGNTSTNIGRMVFANSFSAAYNVVDREFGTENNQSGWEQGIGDKTVHELSFSPNTFKLLPGSAAANVITILPEGYPTVDFYGNTITNGAAAGAVQTVLNGNAIDFIMNNTVRSMVSASPAPDENSLYPNTVTLTANPTTRYEFLYWLINGEKEGNSSPKTITINGYTQIQAVFAINVNSTNDDVGSESVPGTLRYALSNALDGDVVNIKLVKPNNVIAITRELPQITKSITIEGNGSTLTRNTSWTTINSSSQLLNVNGFNTVNIRRLHFKDGRVTADGGAIHHQSGNLNLESCIFSGNSNINNSYGGAIYNRANLNIKGCTFYGNNGNGAIYNNNSLNAIILTLTGNLFYGNSNALRNYRYGYSYDPASGGYNLVDVVTFGSNYNGWVQAIGDKIIDVLPLSPIDFRLNSGSQALNVISTLPEGYPTIDFYGDPITNGAAAGAVQSVE